VLIRHSAAGRGLPGHPHAARLGHRTAGTIGQDIEVSRFDGSDGTIATHFLFNDAVTNTHDILHATALTGETLFVLSAATFDTLNILNKHTEISLTAFSTDATTHVNEAPSSFWTASRVAIADRLSSLLPPGLPGLVLIDPQGRSLAHGTPAEMDGAYHPAPPGLYLVRDATNGTPIIRVMHP